MWGPHEDEDYLGNPAKIAMFDMPEHWDPVDDPHPNTKIASSFMDFGKKYISDFNSDPTGGTGFAAIPDAYKTGQEVTQNSGYIPASQQANNQGLLANVAKPESQTTMAKVSYSAPVMPKAITAQHTASGNTLPKTDSAFTRSLDSIAQAKLNEGSATPEFLKATTQGYLQGRHDVVPAREKAESTATADFLRTMGQATGNTMMRTGSDKAAHDSGTNYNLHYSQDPTGYSDWVKQSWDDAGTASITTDSNQAKHIIDTYGDDAALGAELIDTRLENITNKTAMLINEGTTIGADRYKNRQILAQENVNNKHKWNDINFKMMTTQDIRRDTPENFANDMFKYMYQTGLSRHFINLAMVRAYRGAPFMTKNGVDIIDASLDIWSEDILRNPDARYRDALNKAVKENTPKANDMLISLLAQYFDGPTGDALQFFWDTSTQEQKNQMMKEVYKQQQERMQSGLIGGSAAVYSKKKGNTQSK